MYKPCRESKNYSVIHQRGDHTDKNTYAQLVKKHAPPSKKLRNCLLAFLIGGAFCVFAESVKSLLARSITDEKVLSSWVTVIMIAVGVLLTALGIYDRLAKFAGAGSLVPITGFANAVSSPSIEYRREGIITGTTVGMFSIAGPVIVFGISAAIIYGLIIYAFGLY